MSVPHPTREEKAKADRKPAMQRNRILWTSSIAVILVLLLLAIFYIKKTHDLNFGVVVSGVLMRSAQPAPADLARILDKCGLKTIVNLRSAGAVASESACLAEKTFAEEHGIRLVNIPIGLPPTEEQINEFLGIVDDPKNYPILVHCAEGQGRTSMMCTVYGVERLGWSNDVALAEQIPFKFDRCRANKEEMREFILNYRPGRQMRNIP